MNAENEARCPEPVSSMPPSAYGLAQEAAGNVKEVVRRDMSHIDHNPDNQVVLSQRLEQLCRRVGGCQTDELLALVRRVMYEVLSNSKR
jgi:hypothetical protein